MAWTTILLEAEVPPVPKKARLAPNARAAMSWAFLMLPVGSSRLSRPAVVADDSARKMLVPEKWPMARIQLDRNTDLPRAIGSAWKVPIVRAAYFFRLSKYGVS